MYISLDMRLRSDMFLELNMRLILCIYLEVKMSLGWKTRLSLDMYYAEFDILAEVRHVFGTEHEFEVRLVCPSG